MGSKLYRHVFVMIQGGDWCEMLSDFASSVMKGNITFELAHSKTYNKTCVTSKDSDRPAHPFSMARVLVYPSLDSLEAVKGTCDQRRLRSDCANAQSDLSLRWSHKSYTRICRALAQIRFAVHCSNDSVNGWRRLRSDCADEQADLGPLLPACSIYKTPFRLKRIM